MQDYTFNRVPVSQMRDADLEEVLKHGFDFNELCGVPEPEARRAVLERLELEVFIRKHNLRKDL